MTDLTIDRRTLVIKEEEHEEGQNEVTFLGWYTNERELKTDNY